MASQTVVEIYRTGEHGGTFRAAFTISYFGQVAFIQGLSGKFTKSCWMELYAYFLLTGITSVQFVRMKPSGPRLAVVNIR